MATRCMMMLDCVDARAKSLLKKHARNRPLGDLQAKHNISLQEPHLLVEPVDVNLYMDLAKPYRVMSADDIIEDQHRVMHQLPSKSTPRTYQGSTGTAVSAPVRRRTQPRTAEQLKDQPHVKDILAVSSRYMRPVTSQHRHHSTPKHIAKRPSTTGSVKRPRPEFMTIKLDKDLLESARNYQQSQSELRRQFDETADLTEGNFVRGKKKSDSSSASLDGSGQWLTFGGGSHGDGGGGAIDAFTSMKKPEEYYIVEGVSGSHLAQKIKEGDRVRIGKNGIVQQTEKKVRRDKFDTIYHDYEQEYHKEIEDIGGKPIPLSWEDQVSWEKVTVIKPSASKENSPRINLCETHPVQFEKLNKDEERPKLARSNVSKGNYRVQTAKKSRRRIDGIKTAMDELSICKGTGDEYDPDYENPLRYEEIIQEAVATSAAANKKSSPRRRKLNTYQYPRWQENSSDFSEVKIASPREYLRSVSKLSMAESTMTTASELRQHMLRQVSTPMHTSHDPELSIIAPGQRDKSRVDYDRSPSPIRPPTATPLHKTSARAGVSITPNGMQGETEFIKIATSMKTPHHSNQTPAVIHSPSGRQRYIIQVEDTNIGHYGSDRRYDNLPGYGLEMFDHPRVMEGNESDNTNNYRTNTPVSFDSRPLSGSSLNHRQMSVNVPTGGATSMASSDVNSMSDFLEFEVPNTVQNVPQHTPIPEENTSFVDSVTSSRMGALRAGLEHLTDRPSTVLCKSVTNTSRPSTATSLKSDTFSLNEKPDSLEYNGHVAMDNGHTTTMSTADGDEENSALKKTSAKVNSDSNKSNESEEGEAEDSEKLSIEVTITRKPVRISPETRRFIETVSKHNPTQSQSFQNILSENENECTGSDEPAAELTKLREQIKSELKDSQIMTEAELQDMYMHQQYVSERLQEESG